MNKNILLSSLLLASSMFAANDVQIINYFKAQIPVPSLEIKVVSRVAVDGLEGMEYVTLFASDGQRGQEISVFTKDNLIFPDVISIDNGGSFKEKIDRQNLLKNLSKLYKEENPKNIIVLGNDPKKETIVVFSDPECPFCNKELQKIEQRLETNNIKMLLTPVHDRSSLEKSVLIYKQTAATKDLGQKIKILKKYFNGDVDDKVSDEEVQGIQALITKYFTAGLKGVPFIISEKELLK